MEKADRSRPPDLQFCDALRYWELGDRSHAKNKKTAWRQALGSACRIPATRQRRFCCGCWPPQPAWSPQGGSLDGRTGRLAVTGQAGKQLTRRCDLNSRAAPRPHTTRAHRPRNSAGSRAAGSAGEYWQVRPGASISLIATESTQGNKNVIKTGMVSFRVFPWVPWP